MGMRDNDVDYDAGPRAGKSFDERVFREQQLARAYELAERGIRSIEKIAHAFDIIGRVLERFAPSRPHNAYSDLYDRTREVPW